MLVQRFNSEGAGREWKPIKYATPALVRAWNFRVVVRAEFRLRPSLDRRIIAAGIRGKKRKKKKKKKKKPARPLT